VASQWETIGRKEGRLHAETAVGGFFQQVNRRGEIGELLLISIQSTELEGEP